MEYPSKTKQYQKEYMRKHRASLRAKKLCLNCHKKIVNDLKYCSACLRKERERNRKNWKKNRAFELERGRLKYFNYKKEALKKVSGKEFPVCVNCGISDIRVLTINHIDGFGWKETDGYTHTTYLIAIALGKRKIDDLDVRCHNCNILYEYERGKYKLPKKVKVKI